MKQFILLLISIYKKILSPPLTLIFGHGCRFTPTCSDYAMVSIERFGVVKGGILSLKRISRCHPFSKGYYDPVPEKQNND